jgi:hypothetical protein
MNPDRAQLKVYVARTQRDRLNEVAAERGVSAGSLIRDHIRTLTGEADPVAVKARTGQGKRRRKTDT